MPLTDRTKTSMIILAVLLVAALLFIPWGQSTSPGSEYAVSELDLSALAEAPGVQMTVSDITGDEPITATLQNDSQQLYRHGWDLIDSACLDIERAGVWYRLPLVERATFPALLYELAPGVSVAHQLAQSLFDPALVVGSYRLCLFLEDTDGTPYYAVAYFSVTVQ